MEGLARSHDAVEQPMQLAVPDLAPGAMSGQPERLRMLGAEHRTIGVVVENGEFESPEQDDLRLRREEHAERASKTLRPRVRGAERTIRPVHLAHAGAHVAAP